MRFLVVGWCCGGEGVGGFARSVGGVDVVVVVDRLLLCGVSVVVGGM